MEKGLNMKYFVDTNGIIHGPCIADNPANPNGYTIVELVNLPDAFAVCRLVNGSAVVDATLLAARNTTLAASIRAKRDALLAACDWTTLSDAPLTTAQKTAWVSYRAALRDIPEQSGFPTSVIWPDAPA
jgi:hypothetical protein